MNITSRNVLAVVLAVAASATVTPQAQAKAMAPKPKVTVAQAEAAAVKKIAGTALSAKYEFEDGRWQYAVIVKNKSGQLYEVEVNATTAKVMDTEKTSAAEEAKEAAADRKAASKHGKGKMH